MTEKKISVLEDLYSDSGPFDENRVAAVLKRVLALQRKDHAVFFKGDIGLTAEEKVLAFGLIRKLLKAEGVMQSSSISGKDFAKQTGTKKGTVDVTFKKLRESGFLVGSGSNYEIPIHKIEAALIRLEEATNDKGK